MAASDIDPKALADALRRIRGEKADDPAVLQYISTHPGFDEPRAIVRAGVGKLAGEGASHRS